MALGGDTEQNILATLSAGSGKDKKMVKRALSKGAEHWRIGVSHQIK